MAVGQGVRRAAAAIRAEQERKTDRGTRELEYAEVLQTSPLVVAPHEHSFILDEDDLVLGQWLRRYDDDIGIKVGDTIVIKPMRNGDWIATDIVSSEPAVAEGEEPGTSDGEVPLASPAATVRGGLGFLAVSWDPVDTPDPVTYEVYMHTSSGFSPTLARFVGKVDGTTLVVASEPDGSPLAHATPYYVRIVATDADGAAAPGAEDSAVLMEIGDY